MNGTRVRVRRERPTVLAWSIALAVTMLAVYVLTLNASLPDSAESASATPRVTREIALEALEGWCVSLGSWPTEFQARIEAADYAARGAAGRVFQGGGVWQVLGAIFDSEAAARREAQRLRDEAGLEAADVLPLSAGRVKLRVTATNSEIDWIQRAADALRNQSWQLSDMAMALDRGTIQWEAARALCALAATEAEELETGLSGIAGARDNALCASLIGAFSRLSRHLQEIAQSPQGTGPALSGLLRRVGADCFFSLKEIQEGL